MKTSKDFSSRKEWENFLWEEFINYLYQSDSKATLRKKLDSLFSEHERKLAIRRLTALILMKDGMSYKRIGEILWIAPATISALKKNANHGYQGRKNNPKSSNHSSIPEYRLARQKNSEVSSRLEDFLISILEGYTNPKKRWEFYNKYK